MTQERCDTPCDSAQIEPKPAPGAYLLESTKQNAEYWERGARDLAKEGKTIEEVMQCYMQAMFAYRNAAYGLAEKLHFAGYDPKTGTVASESTSRWVSPLERQPDVDGRLWAILTERRENGKLTGFVPLYEYYHFDNGWATDDRILFWLDAPLHPLPKVPNE